MTTIFLACPKCGEQLEKTIDYAAILRLRCPECGYKKNSTKPDPEKIKIAQANFFDNESDYSSRSYIGIGWQK